ncbi:MAG TPA: chemotaxis protein CheA [Steroidobacteraceae bacterium]|nr:chemotaxis protein CheA [Steroidobacteraceae bacterium]
MNLDEALSAFVTESAELLEEMESGLLACAQAGGDPATINRVFRAAHTLKGSSGLFGLAGIVAFVHGMETALDRVRLGQVAMDQQLVAVLLRATDHAAGLIGSIAEGTRGRAYDAADGSGGELTAQLRALAGDFAAAPAAAAATAAPAMAEPAAAVAQAQCTPADHWHISVRFGADVLRAGMDPVAMIRYLRGFARLQGVEAVAAIPDAADMDPEACYLGFELGLRTDAARERIESAFDFVREDCTLRILPPGSAQAEYLQLLRQAGLDAAQQRRALAACGGLPAVRIEQLLGAQTDADAAGQAAGMPQAEAAAAWKSTGAERTVRVAAQKLDHLIDRIGELITAAAGANLAAHRAGHPELEEATAAVAALIEEVREGALQLRMVRIGATFARYRRVVHDAAAELGKQIRLAVSGEEAELDKTVVEQIADPLTHLVRNAMDHGIEAAAVRAQRGKPAVGTVSLNAFHDSGSIVIEVGDDGGGLDRELILAKALERGLIEPGRSLGEQELFGLIFEPGFSTAGKITNLSGRGVGMDVVKRNITALRGTVSVRSAAGRGTTVAIRLPLTLAIIDGFQVAVGSSSFVLPLQGVEQCLDFQDEGRDFIGLPGEVLPLIRLRRLFAVPQAASRRESVVVIRAAGRRAGLVVDALLGGSQTVIKPLPKMFSQVECVSGSSILGSGEIALILDVAALVQAAERSQGAGGRSGSWPAGRVAAGPAAGAA